MQIINEEKVMKKDVSNENLLVQYGKDAEARVNNAIKHLRVGKGILLVDSPERENEGDYIFPAQTMTVSNMAQTIRECSGIVCLCIRQNQADRLGLKLMTNHNTSAYGTNFTQSIEAAVGVTTGVSAHDRIQTIKIAIEEASTASDIHIPGHVFPLISKENGVLERAGHTEGSVDLVSLAGFNPCAVLCELTNVDGTMARLTGIVDFANDNETVVISIDDIISYRKQKGLLSPIIQELHR